MKKPCEVCQTAESKVSATPNPPWIPTLLSHHLSPPAVQMPPVPYGDLQRGLLQDPQGPILLHRGEGQDGLCPLRGLHRGTNDEWCVEGWRMEDGGWRMEEDWDHFWKMD